MMKPIKILFLSANPRNITQLELEQEAEAIRSRIKSEQNGNWLELIPYFAATKEILREALLKHRPHVLHFSGHGSPTKGILLEDSSGNIERVHLDAIAELISIIKDNLRVVVLNACYSALQAEEISQVVEATIGMRHEIGDSAAIEFAAALYEGLANGLSLKGSFEMGKNALKLAGISETHIPDLLEGLGVDTDQLYLGESFVIPANPIDPLPEPPRQSTDGTMQIDVIVLQRGTSVKIEAWRYATRANQDYFITLDSPERRLPIEAAWQGLLFKINRLASVNNDSPNLASDVFLFLRGRFAENLNLLKLEEMVRNARDHSWGSNIYVVWDQTSQTKFESLYGDDGTKLENWFRVLLKYGVTDLIEIPKKEKVREDDQTGLLHLLRDCAAKSGARRQRMLKLVSDESWGITLRDGAFFLEEFLSKFFSEEAPVAQRKNLIVYYDQRPPKSWIQLVENSRIFDRIGNWFVALGRNDKRALKDLKPLWIQEASVVKPRCFDDIFIFDGAVEWLYSVIRLRQASVSPPRELVSTDQADVEWVPSTNNASLKIESGLEDLRLLITSTFVLQEEHFTSTGYANVVKEQRDYFIEAAQEVGAVLRNLQFNVAVEVYHCGRVNQLAALLKKKQFTAWLFLGHRNAPGGLRPEFDQLYADPQVWLYGFKLLKGGSVRLVCFSSFASTAISKKLVTSGVQVAVGFEDVAHAAACRDFSAALNVAALIPGQRQHAILSAFSKAGDEYSGGENDSSDVRPKAFAAKLEES